MAQIEFLGHLVSAGGITPKPDKLDVIANLKAPKTLRELRGLLGTLGFYQTYIPNFATLARPISKLMSTKTNFHWDAEQEAALARIKAAFANIDTLSMIDPENTQEFILVTDASGTAIGAQLLRIDGEGRQLVVTNVSRALTLTESRYSNTERELLSYGH